MDANTCSRRKGFTVTELLIGVAILTIMLALASAGYVRLVRNSHESNVQAEIDIDVRKSIEMLRANLRLTTIEQVLLYPFGAGPYTAISFPAAADNNRDGLIDLTPAGTNIVWGETVIYHVWPGTPAKLLRTTFCPRVNTLTDTDRIEQLRRVVENDDHGRSFTLEPYAGTQVIFKNMLIWKLSALTKPYNGYNAYLRPEELQFGSAYLAPGNHTLMFRTLAAGTGGGFKIGLDLLRASASGSDREAEEQTYAAAGAAARNTDYQSSGAWSGNRQLVLDATASNQTLSVTLRNDEWEESNFDHGGTFNRTAVNFVDADKDYELMLSGKGDAWLAGQQTRSDMAFATNDLRGYCVRVLIRGSSMPDGGAIMQNGSLILAPSYNAPDMRCLVMRLPPSMSVSEWASIARVNGTNYTAAIDTASARWIKLIRQSTSGGGELVYGYYPDWWYTTPYDFSRTNTYALTVNIQKTSDNANLAAWTEANTNAPGSYVVLAPDGDPWSLMTRSWSTTDPGFAVHRKIYLLERIITGYALNGTFVSQVFDTGKTAPAYDTASWLLEPAGGNVTLAFRSGSDSVLTNMAWSTATVNGQAPLGMGSGRYVQFRASLTPNATASTSPRLKRVRLGWPGDERIVNLSAIGTLGPEYGIFDVTLDGTPLVRSVCVDLTVFRDVMTEGRGIQRLTSSMRAEVEPRNTGK